MAAFKQAPPFPNLESDDEVPSEDLCRVIQRRVKDLKFKPIGQEREGVSDMIYWEQVRALQPAALKVSLEEAANARVNAWDAKRNERPDTQQLEDAAKQAAEAAFDQAAQLLRSRSEILGKADPWRNLPNGKRIRIQLLNPEEKKLKEWINNLIQKREIEILEEKIGPCGGDKRNAYLELCTGRDCDFFSFSGTMKTRQRKRSNSSKSAARRKSPRRKKSPRGKKSPPRKKSLRGKKSPRGRKRKSRNRQR
tara:strand:- start:3061 stop:3813 length:753 start_codon:yes stop_codon:yes gene_type:complete